MLARQLRHGDRFWLNDGKLYQYLEWFWQLPLFAANYMIVICLRTCKEKIIYAHFTIELFEDFYWDGAGI